MEHATTPPVAVIMGVAGCGKTTVGTALAERLDVEFRDADAFHPQANIDKQAAGQPLNDEDRKPWLEAIAAWLDEKRSKDQGAVVTCSALKRSYRDLLRTHVADLPMLHLAGPQEVAAQRVANRPGHFMPASLVQSQYDTLEPLQDDERGLVADFTQPVDTLVDTFYDYLTR